MAAPKGNRFWELRSKHGRDAIFTDSDKMYQAAESYFLWCEENPLMEVAFVGKDATRVEIPKMRAFTLEGLCLSFGSSASYWRQFKETKTAKKQGFTTVITRIEEIIRVQKFTGAAAGFLNPTIIARDLGLRDKQEIEHSGDMNVSQTVFQIVRKTPDKK
jgi:hypothetical protein